MSGTDATSISPMAEANENSEIILLGTSFKTAGIGFREKFAAALMREEGLGSLVGLREFSVLQTCNRVELYCFLKGDGSSVESILNQLGCDSQEGLYIKRGLDAIRHLFNVAIGFDSVAIGEDQILRQVRSAGLRAGATGNAKSILTPLFDSACTSSMRIRKRFRIASEGHSLSEIALNLAIERLGRKPRDVLIAGTGETARLAALRLRGARIHLFTNRRKPMWLPQNSVKVGRKSLSTTIAKCQLIVSATRRSNYLFSRKDIPVVGRRVILDLGFPRNVDPAVRSLGSVELIDLDVIASHVAKSHVHAISPPAQNALEAEAIRFQSWLTATRLNPTLATMFKWAEQVREDETASALRRLPGLSGRERRVLETLSRRLVSRLMAPHAEFAKENPSSVDQAGRLRLLEKIFQSDRSN